MYFYLFLLLGIQWLSEFYLLCLSMPRCSLCLSKQMRAQSFRVVECVCKRELHLLHLGLSWSSFACKDIELSGPEFSHFLIECSILKIHRCICPRGFGLCSECQLHHRSCSESWRLMLTLCTCWSEATMFGEVLQQVFSSCEEQWWCAKQLVRCNRRKYRLIRDDSVR